MNPQHLSRKLFNVIIEYLQGDNPTLCSCSLVSRSWTSSAHRLRFRHLQCTLRPGSTQYKGLFSFLQASPMICKYVQVLTLRGEWANIDTEIDGALLSGTLAVLPSLKELHMARTAITPQQPDTPKVATGDRTLEVLSMRHVKILGESPLSSLHQLLLPFSSVETLRIDGVFPDITFGDKLKSVDSTLDVLASLSPLIHHRVKSVTLTSPTVLGLFFVETFTEFSHGTIQFLHLELPPPHSDVLASELNRMLKAIGPGLRELSVDIPTITRASTNSCSIE